MKKSLITLLVVTCAIAAHATKFYFNAPSTWTYPFVHVWNCGGDAGNVCVNQQKMTPVPGIPNWYYYDAVGIFYSICNIIFSDRSEDGTTEKSKLAEYEQRNADMPAYMTMSHGYEGSTHRAVYLGGEGTSAPVFNKMTLYFQKPSSWTNDAQTRVYISTTQQGAAYILSDETMKAVPDADGWYYLEFYYLSDQTTNNYFQFRNGSTGDYTSALNAAFSSNGTLYLKSDGSTTSLAESTERPSVITYCGN